MQTPHIGIDDNTSPVGLWGQRKISIELISVAGSHNEFFTSSGSSATTTRRNRRTRTIVVAHSLYLLVHSNLKYSLKNITQSRQSCLLNFLTRRTICGYNPPDVESLKVDKSIMTASKLKMFGLLLTL